jgi:hypothetical protein
MRLPLSLTPNAAAAHFDLPRGYSPLWRDVSHDARSRCPPGDRGAHGAERAVEAGTSAAAGSRLRPFSCGREGRHGPVSQRDRLRPRPLPSKTTSFPALGHVPHEEASANDGRGDPKLSYAVMTRGRMRPRHYRISAKLRLTQSDHIRLVFLAKLHPADYRAQLAG